MQAPGFKPEDGGYRRPRGLSALLRSGGFFWTGFGIAVVGVAGLMLKLM